MEAGKCQAADNSAARPAMIASAAAGPLGGVCDGVRIGRAGVEQQHGVTVRGRFQGRLERLDGGVRAERSHTGADKFIER